MKKIFLSVCVVFGVLCMVCDKLTAENQKAEVQTQKFVLDNGLTVLISEMPGSSTASVFGLVKTGSATEGKYLGTGISHFLEHMLFKGTDKRGVGQIPKEVQALGGQINASTSFDYTIYTLTVPETAFAQGLDIISDMLMNSKFDDAEIQKEREVVYGEMRLYKDRPERYLSQMVFNTVYKQHPYGIPIIGYEDLLRGLKREDFVDYYKTHYAPNNIIISIAGHVRADDVLPKVRAAFKDFKRQPNFVRNLTSEPTQINMRYLEEEYQTDLTRVEMAYSGVSLRDSDLYALDVLAMILGQGESSRLYKEIFLNKKLVRSITTANYTPMDRGVFEVEMVLDEKDVDSAILAVKEQIQLVAQKGVDLKELDKVKRQVYSQNIFGRLTSDVVANNAAADEAFIGDYDFSKKYVEAIKKVNSADIQRVAKQYFHDDKLSLVILKPKKLQTDAAQSTDVVKPLAIEKIILDNGLTILLRENHSFPIVSINLAMNGGMGQETVEKNGTSELTSRLLTEGTKTKTADQIAESIESRGASLTPFSGRNSLGIIFNLLSEDTDFGLGLLEDLIKNPIFPENELNREKDKMRTALIAQEDSINAVTSRHLRELLFLTHPYRRDGLGTLDSIEKIQRSDIVDFYQRHFVPNNMVISVFGDIDSEKILTSLKKRFGSLVKKDLPILTYAENPPTETREKTIRLKKQQAMVIIGFQGVDLKSPDRYPLQVLSSILGSSFNGRIFTTIRDQFGQAYTLGGGFTPSRDMGMVSFYVLTNDENVMQVKESLEKLLIEIRENKVSETELNEMKTYLKGSFRMNLETDSSLGFIATLDELYGNGYDYYESFYSRIDAVTADDIQRLAAEYLDLKKAAIVVTRPTEQILENTMMEKPVMMPATAPTEIH